LADLIIVVMTQVVHVRFGVRRHYFISRQITSQFSTPSKQQLHGQKVCEQVAVVINVSETVFRAHHEAIHKTLKSFNNYVQHSSITSDGARD